MLAENFLAKNQTQDFPGGPVVRLRALNAGDLGLIPSQRARSHMPQLIFSTAKQTYQSISSVAVMSNSLWPHGLHHARLPCPLPSPRACSNSRPLSRWCHPAISSSIIPFSCLQSFPASGSFLMSWLFASGGQSTGASATVLLMNIQEWFLLELTGLISLQSKGLSKVFSSTTVQKHQFHCYGSFGYCPQYTCLILPITKTLYSRFPPCIKNSIKLTCLTVYLVAQSCSTLCDPMDCSPPGSSVYEVFQARILEWVTIFLLQGIFPT